MRARRDGVARVVDVFGCVIDLERVSARALIWHCRPRLGEESDDATMTGTADDADDADARREISRRDRRSSVKAAETA